MRNVNFCMGLLLVFCLLWPCCLIGCCVPELHHRVTVEMATPVPTLPALPVIPTIPAGGLADALKRLGSTESQTRTVASPSFPPAKVVIRPNGQIVEFGPVEMELPSIRD